MMDIEIVQGFTPYATMDDIHDTELRAAQNKIKSQSNEIECLKLELKTLTDLYDKLYNYTYPSISESDII